MMSVWNEIPLKDLTEAGSPITYGVVKPGPIAPDGVLFIRGGDIVAGEIRVAQLRTISHSVSNQYKRTLLRGGELLVSLVGNPGEVAIVPPSLRKANIARQVGLIRLHSDVDARYVKYFLRSPQGRIALGLRSSGSVQRVINLGDLQTLRIPVPPLEYQRGVAGILGALDEKIEINRSACATLEIAARALFQSWFVDFAPVRVKVEHQSHKPASTGDLIPDQFRDLPLGEIPVGWKIGKLGDVLVQRIERCTASFETINRPYVPIDCISSDSLLLMEVKPGAEAQSSLTKFYRGDLLFGAMRPYFHKVCIAPFAGTTRSTVFVLSPKTQVDLSFATLLLHDATTVAYATRHSTGSTIPYAVWPDSLEAMQVVLPPPEVRIAFDRAVRPILERIQAFYFEISTLRTLRDTLLPQIVSGKLRIPETALVLESA